LSIVLFVLYLLVIVLFVLYLLSIVLFVLYLLSIVLFVLYLLSIVLFVLYLLSLYCLKDKGYRDKQYNRQKIKDKQYNRQKIKDKQYNRQKIKDKQYNRQKIQDTGTHTTIDKRYRTQGNTQVRHIPPKMSDKFESQHSLSPTIWLDILVLVGHFGRT
jgi:Ca2+/Na+ antiporter